MNHHPWSPLPELHSLTKSITFLHTKIFRQKTPHKTCPTYNSLKQKVRPLRINREWCQQDGRPGSSTLHSSTETLENKQEPSKPILLELWTTFKGLQQPMNTEARKRQCTNGRKALWCFNLPSPPQLQCGRLQLTFPGWELSPWFPGGSRADCICTLLCVSV